MSMKYGMPCMEAKFYSQQSSFLDRLFTDCTAELILPTEEQECQELVQVVGFAAALATNFELQARYRIYDQSIESYICGMGESDLVKEIFADIRPLIYKLKLHYGQARPFQIATSLDLKLYPAASLTANCPSFPSMHSTSVAVLYSVFAVKFQVQSKRYEDLAHDVMKCRMHMGVCLASDIEAGRKLAEKITSDSEFMIKYQLSRSYEEMT